MLRALFLTFALAFTPIAKGSAQQAGLPSNPILIVDSDFLFNQSQFGQRVVNELDVEGRVLAAENRDIEGELSEEEQQLTNQRSSMSAEEFRILADAFDQKVQTTREQQLNKTKALNLKIDTQRVTFLNAAAPILQSLMKEADASVLLERRNVVLSTGAVDITAVAIERIDSVLGNGSQPVTSGD